MYKKHCRASVVDCRHTRCGNHESPSANLLSASRDGNARDNTSFFEMSTLSRLVMAADVMKFISARLKERRASQVTRIAVPVSENLINIKAHGAAGKEHEGRP